MLISTASTRTAPGSSNRVNAVIIRADRSVPQPAATTIIWTATPLGGRGPCEYKWLIYNGCEWDVVKNWSGSNTLRWTPAFANPRYRVSVWVRSTGSTVDDFEATTEAAFAIDEIAGAAPSPKLDSAMPQATSAPAQPVSTVTLRANPPSPQPAGTTIVWTAAATGGGAGRQYKWFVYDGSSWTPAAPWSTSDTLVWTPISANPRYRVAVWARSAGSVNDYFEACAEVGFAVVER